MDRRKILAWLLDQWPAKILSLGFAVVLFFFTNLVDMRSASITMEVRYILPSGMVQSEDFPREVKLNVRSRGTVFESFKPDDIQVLADFSFVHDEGIYQTPVRVKAQAGKGALDTYEFEVSPPVIQVRLENIQKKVLPVKVAFESYPRNGFELRNYSVVPAEVTVTGPRSLMTDLTWVETDPVELESRSSSFTQRLRIRSPASLVSFTSSEFVDFKAEITETVLPMVFSAIPVEIRNAAPGHSVYLATEKVKVRVEAPGSVLQELDSDHLHVWVDLAGVTVPGTYLIPLGIDLPENVMAKDLVPDTVQVRIEVASSGTGGEIPREEMQ